METRTVKILIDDAQMQKSLEKAQAKAQTLENKLSKMDTGSKQWAETNAQLQKVNAQIGTLEGQLSGKLEPSTSQLRAEWHRLRVEIEKMPNNLAKATEEYKRFTAIDAKLKGLRKEQELLNQTTKQADKLGAGSSVMGQIKSSIIGTFAGNAALMGVQTIGQYIFGAIDKMKLLSDAQSDVIKTTGLTESEFHHLENRLSKIDTRASRGELLKLSAEAGRLGVSGVENIAKFVKEADIINTALGEDLGEGALVQMGRLSELFDEEILNIGSMVNKLADSGSASAKFEVEFLSRTAPLKDAAGLRAAALGGYSAVVEEAGLQVEMTGTALNSFFMDFVKDTEKFGKAAGFGAGELTKLKNELGTNEAFLKFLEAMKAGTNGQDDFLKKMEELGINGDRGSVVFLTLAQNIDKVRKKQEIAAVAIKDASNVTAEYNKRNNNLAADLEKAEKKLNSFFNNNVATDGLKGLIQSTAQFIINLRTTSEELEYNTKAVMEQTAEVDKLNNEINPLLTRYDELKGKTNLSAKEQEELNKILSKLQETLPLTVMEFNKYGEVIGVNTTKSREYISQLKEINALQTKDQRQNLADEAAKNYQRLKQMSSSFQINLKNNEKYPAKTQEDREAQAKRIQASQEAMQALRTETKGYLVQLEQLGSKLDDSFNVSRIIWGTGKYKIALKDIAKEVGFVSADIQKANEKTDNNDNGNKPTTPSPVVRNLTLLKNELKDYQEQLEKAEIGSKRFFELQKLIEAKNKEISSAQGKTTKTQDDKSSEILYEKIKKLAEDNRIALGKEDTLTEERVRLKYSRMEAEGLKYFDKTHDYFVQLEQAKNDELEKVRNESWEKEVSAMDKQFQEDLKRIEKNYAEVKKLRQSLTDAVAKNAADELAAHHSMLENIVGDEKRSVSERKSAQEELFKNELAQLEQKQQTQKTALEEQMKAVELTDAQRTEMAAQLVQLDANTANQRLLIEQTYQDAVADMEAAALQRKVNAVADFATNATAVYSSINQVFDNGVEGRLNKLTEAHETELQQLEEQKNRKVISDAQYNQQKKAIDDKYRAEEAKIKERQFQRQKVADMVQAGINTAVSITKTFAQFGWPAGIIPASIALAGGLAQQAVIASKQTPKFGKGGDFRGKGRSHAQGGNPVLDPITGQIIAELEEGEVLLSKATALNNAPIVDALLDSSMNNGGAAINLPTNPILDFAPFFNAQKIMMATGGRMGEVTATSTVTKETTHNYHLPPEFAALVANVQTTVNRLNNTLQNGISARFNPETVRDISEEQGKQSEINNQSDA